ncbi:unnamed protein product, partial [Iphiclides podalirius]
MEENSSSGVPLSFHAPAKSRRASSTSSASSSASSSAGHHHRKNRNRRNDKRMKRLEKAVDNLTATVSTIVKDYISKNGGVEKVFMLPASNPAQGCATKTTLA